MSESSTLTPCALAFSAVLAAGFTLAALPALIALLGGLLLWTAGGKVLKWGVLLICVGALGALGAAIGFVAAHAVGAGVGLLIGTIGGLWLGWSFLRWAGAVAMACALGLVGGLVGLALASATGHRGARLPELAALHAEPEPEPDPELQPNGLGGEDEPLIDPEERRAWPTLPAPVIRPDAPPGGPADGDEPTPSPARKPAPKPAAKPKPEAKPEMARKAQEASAKAKAGKPATSPSIEGVKTGMQNAARKVGTTGQQVGAQASALAAQLGADAPDAGRASRWWRGLDGTGQRMVAGFALLGAVAGALAGFFMPAKAMALLTAGAGGVMMLGAGLWLAGNTGLSWPRPDSMPPMGWLLAWVVLALVGVAIQTGLGGGKAAPKVAARGAKGAGKKK